MKKLDKLENEFLPQVMVDSTEVIFDTLRFLEAKTKELIIANTGQVRVGSCHIIGATFIYGFLLYLFVSKTPFVDISSE